MCVYVCACIPNVCASPCGAQSFYEIYDKMFSSKTYYRLLLSFEHLLFYVDDDDDDDHISLVFLPRLLSFLWRAKTALLSNVQFIVL